MKQLSQIFYSKKRLLRILSNLTLYLFLLTIYSLIIPYELIKINFSI